jgi:hypothetical protein
MLDSKLQTLPGRRPDRMWGGPACGSKCAICDLSLTRDGVELEIEFDQDGDLGPDTYHVHVPCFVAWERTLVEDDRAGDDRNGGQQANGDRGAVSVDAARQ